MEEKNKEKNRQLHKQHKELIELRNASEIKKNKMGFFQEGGDEYTSVNEIESSLSRNVIELDYNTVFNSTCMYKYGQMQF